MNLFIDSLNLWAARCLEFAIPMLWQSSLLIALIFALDFALRRKVRAAVRYTLWFVVLLKLLLPPTLALPTGPAWWLRTSKTQALVPRKVLMISYPVGADEVSQPAISIPVPPPPPPQLSAASWKLLASTAASIFLLTWLLARWRQIARQIHAASPAPPQIVELFNQIQHETQSRFPGPRSSRRESAPSSPHGPSQSGLTSAATRVKKAQIRLVPAPISPAVCGLFRPIILLPEALVEQLSPAQLRAVLLHELIHLRRRDVWMNCFQTFLQIAYWWHPLLWLANARIRRLREESVDDAVMLALNDDSEVYAPTLLEVAKLAFHRQLASLGLVGILESKNALRQRIERLLNFTTPRRAGLSILSVVCIAAFTAVAVPMGEAPARSSDPNAALDSTNLIPYHTKVDPDVFIRNIRARASETMHTTNDPWGDILLSILDGYGIDCTPPRGLALNNQTGDLSTENTPEALQVLDEIVKELNLPAGERTVTPHYNDFKQVLIVARFYQMQVAQFAQLDLNSSDRNRNRDSSPSWNLSSNEISRVAQSIKNLGLRPFCSPRIQTTHGVGATLNTGDKTNGIELECLPYIHDGAVDLAVLARTTGKYAPPGGWSDFAGRTNCAIFSRVGFEDGGGAVLQAQPTGASSESNLVVLLRAKIIQGPPTAVNRIVPRSNATPPQAELLTRTFKVDSNSFYLGIQRLSAKLTGSNQSGNGANAEVRSDHGSRYVVADDALAEMQAKIIRLVQASGVDLSPPKALFFNDRKGTLTVRATAGDLDAIEKLVAEANTSPPEVNVKARFVEVAATRDSSGRIRPVANAFTDFMKNVLTNKSDSSDFTSGILSETQMESVLKHLQNTNIARLADEFQVTTLSERQAQVSDVDVISVLPGLNVTVTNNQTTYNYQPTNMQVGYVLDVFPEVLSDQHAVSLKLIPTVTQFLGYADPKELSKYDKNLQHAQLPLPKYRRWSITTTAVIPDGQTLVLANLGDETLVGTTPSYKAKLPKNSAKQLLVFITPTLIDKAGNRLYAKSSKDYYNSPSLGGFLPSTIHSKDSYDGPIF